MRVSKDRRRPGPGAPLTAERERYLRLVAHVLVQPEKIGGVVLVLQLDEPPVGIRRVRRPDESRIRFTG